MKVFFTDANGTKVLIGESDSLNDVIEMAKKDAEKKFIYFTKLVMDEETTPPHERYNLCGPNQVKTGYTLEE